MAGTARKTKIITITGSTAWLPSDWHGVDGVDRRWCVRHEGIAVMGETGVRRTVGEPDTIRRIRSSFGEEIDAIAKEIGQPDSHKMARVLEATIAIESRGHPDAERWEPKLRDYSIGLTQTLTATAVELADMAPKYFDMHSEARWWAESLFTKKCPRPPVPSGGNLKAWRKYLHQPLIAIALAGIYHRYQNGRFTMRGDPVLLYAAYNAGGVYTKLDDPWGLRNYDPDGRGPKPGALDGFTRWYGDACAVTPAPSASA